MEAFWSVVNSMRTVDKLASGITLYLFKKGIAPMWEDPQNVNVSSHRPQCTHRLWR